MGLNLPIVGITKSSGRKHVRLILCDVLWLGWTDSKFAGAPRISWSGWNFCDEKGNSWCRVYNNEYRLERSTGKLIREFMDIDSHKATIGRFPDYIPILTTIQKHVREKPTTFTVTFDDMAISSIELSKDQLAYNPELHCWKQKDFNNIHLKRYKEKYGHFLKGHIEPENTLQFKAVANA